MKQNQDLSIEELSSATVIFHSLLIRYLKVNQEETMKKTDFLINVKNRILKLEQSVLLIGDSPGVKENTLHSRDELVDLSNVLLLLEDCKYYIECLQKKLLIFFPIKFETFPANYKELNFIINGAGFCTYYSSSNIVLHSNKASAIESGDIRRGLYFDVESREIRTI